METKQLTSDERRRIAAESRCDMSTIKNYPDHCKEVSRLRIEEAARKLKIELPKPAP